MDLTSCHIGLSKCYKPNSLVTSVTVVLINYLFYLSHHFYHQLNLFSTICPHAGIQYVMGPTHSGNNKFQINFQCVWWILINYRNNTLFAKYYHKNSDVLKTLFYYPFLWDPQIGSNNELVYNELREKYINFTAIIVTGTRKTCDSLQHRNEMKGMVIFVCAFGIDFPLKMKWNESSYGSDAINTFLHREWLLCGSDAINTFLHREWLLCGSDTIKTFLHRTVVWVRHHKYVPTQRVTVLWVRHHKYVPTQRVTDVWVRHHKYVPTQRVTVVWVRHHKYVPTQRVTVVWVRHHKFVPTQRVTVVLVRHHKYVPTQRVTVVWVRHHKYVPT